MEVKPHRNCIFPWWHFWNSFHSFDVDPLIHCQGLIFLKYLSEFVPGWAGPGWAQQTRNINTLHRHDKLCLNTSLINHFATWGHSFISP